MNPIPCEIRVRPVMRHVVTRYFKPMPELGLQGGSECLGEFDNERVADEVAQAMRDADEARCKARPSDEAGNSNQYD